MRQKSQNHVFKFSFHLSVVLEKNYRQMYGKSKVSLWRNLSTGTAKFFLAQSFVLQLQFTSHIFFRTAILRKSFDIRFSYKHCNFSHVCLLVKMASKTRRDKVYYAVIFKESSTIEGNTKLRNIIENVQYEKQIQISKATSKSSRLVQFVY